MTIQFWKHLRMANGGMYGEEEKKKIQLIREEKRSNKKGHVHQTLGARCVRTDNIVKNGIVIEVKVS